MNIDRNLLGQFRDFLGLFTGSLLAGWLSGGLIIVQAAIFSTVIAGVFIQQSSLEDVLPRMAWLAVVILLRTGSIFLQAVSARRLALNIRSRLRKSFFQKILDLGPLDFHDRKSGEVATLAVQGIDSLDAYFSQYIPQLILAAVIPLTILVVVFPMDLLSAIILLLTAPLIPVFMILIGKSAENATKRQWVTLNRMGNYFLDAIQGLTTLKLYNISKEKEKIRSASEKYREVTIQVLRVTFLSSLVLEMVATISTAIVAVQIGLRLLNGGMPFQQALFLLVIAPEFYLPLRSLGLRFHTGITAASVSKALSGILLQEGPTRTGVGKRIEPAVSSVEPIRFDHVCFTYPDRQSPVLQNASFLVQPGKITALVGVSGSGKSTIFNLLLRFIDPQSGSIWIGNHSIDEYSPELWRRLITWVPQTPFLFNTSIAANIHMDAKIDPSRIQWAADEAKIHDFIATLPNGYETQIGEHGYRLSGGQAQRLAIARAFYRDAPLLLLDEPTAYIDPQNANQIQAAIQRLSQSRTTLLIAHHESTLLQADHAVLLHDSQVIAAGDPKWILDKFRAGQFLERQPAE